MKETRKLERKGHPENARAEKIDSKEVEEFISRHENNLYHIDIYFL